MRVKPVTASGNNKPDHERVFGQVPRCLQHRYHNKAIPKSEGIRIHSRRGKAVEVDRID